MHDGPSTGERFFPNHAVVANCLVYVKIDECPLFRPPKVSRVEKPKTQLDFRSLLNQFDPKSSPPIIQDRALFPSSPFSPLPSPFSCPVLARE